MTNFGLFQPERVCRRQFQSCWRWQKALQTDRKHCGKRRNWSLLFPWCFQKICPADMWKPGLVWERVNTINWAFCHLHKNYVFNMNTFKILSLSERVIQEVNDTVTNMPAWRDLSHKRNGVCLKRNWKWLEYSRHFCHKQTPSVIMTNSFPHYCLKDFL